MENYEDINSTREQKIEILKIIREESGYRPIVPFLGAGISVSAGFPTIRFVIQYLTKIDFAIQFGVFEDRFPIIKEDQQSAKETYRRHPSKYIEDFGWPNYGQLNADIWDWLEKGGREKIEKKERVAKEKYKKEFEDYKNLKNNKLPEIPDLLSNDLTENDSNYFLTYKNTRSSWISKPLDLRDHQHAIVQWVLRKDLAERENGTTKPVLYRWFAWKRSYFIGSKSGIEPQLLYGDWEALLDRLCEGNFSLIDALFNGFERNLNPTMSHRYIAFLKPKLGMPVILTTNFDTLLESALQQERISPKVFDIHRDAELPSSYLVHSQFSLIKLHGSAYGIRLGERLKYQLEFDARKNVLGYIPENSLMLVMGFNGSERRIMQMLQAIVRQGKYDNEKPRLIWIQGPSEPGPLFKELINDSKGAVISCKIAHADSFLEELYFYITRNSYQSSNKGYSTVPNRPLILELTEIKLRNEKEKNRHRRQVQICVGGIDGSKSTNWSSLAGMALTNSFDLGYTVIWINLNSHHTVEGIIAEFFKRIRTLDPQAPSCVITNMDKYADEAIKKTIERMSDTFKRGRYILVLEEVESFGRPQLVHHGMIYSKNDQSNQLGEQIKNLKNFLSNLLQINLDADNKYDMKSTNKRLYWDSYIIVTGDNPRLRHSFDANTADESYKEMKELINALRELDDYNHSHLSVYTQKDMGYEEFVSFHCKPESNPASKISEYWLPIDKSVYKGGDNTLKRAQSVLSMLEVFRIKSSNYNLNKVEIEPFVCILSLFRRPRSLPLIHSIINRWALRRIGGAPFDEKNSEYAHRLTQYLLNLISIKESPIGIVSQNHEGGTVWLYREVFESTYSALTENLHVHEWREMLRDGRGQDEKIHIQQAIMDGILNITWHLYASRSYYVDVFLASHDIQAFYEYMYHRVSAIRIITLLIEILSIRVSCIGVDDLDNYCKFIFRGLSTEKWIDADINKLNPFSKYCSIIGIFEPIDSNDVNYGNISDFIIDLKELRVQSVETLLTALKKNKLLFRSVATPDTVIAWANQFIRFELKNMKSIYSPYILGEGDKIFDSVINEIESQFENLRFQARLSKLDYDSILKDCFEKYLNENLVEYPIKEETKLINEIFNDFIKIASALASQTDEESSYGLGSQNYKLFEIKLKNIFLIARCLIERCDPFPAISADSIYKILKSIVAINFDIQKKIKENIRYSLELECRSQFNRWFYWEPLLNREESCKRMNKYRTWVNIKYVKDGEFPENTAYKCLEKAEYYSILFEDILRATTHTNDTDGKFRSTALTLRARAAYLMGNFQQAHHLLDLATSGLLPDQLDHKIYISIVHVVRAELLGISAHEHYFSLSEIDQVLKQFDERIQTTNCELAVLKLRDIFKTYVSCENISCINDFPLKFSDLSKLLLPIVYSSQKKIERAEQELLCAEKLLGDLNHQNIWLIYLELGFAQLKIDRLLYEIEILFLTWKSIEISEYLKKNGQMEQKILDVLKHIRNIMDAIPYRSRNWDQVKTLDERRKNKGLLMFRIECGGYMLWRQLFVIGAFYSSLLNCLYRNKGTIHITDDTNIFDISEQLIPCLSGLAFNGVNATKYQEQWKLWCNSMRFENFSDNSNIRTFYMASSEIENGKLDEGLKSLSLRAGIIKCMLAECNTQKIKDMWDLRRKAPRAGQRDKLRIPKKTMTLKDAADVRRLHVSHHIRLRRYRILPHTPDNTR